MKNYYPNYFIMARFCYKLNEVEIILFKTEAKIIAKPRDYLKNKQIDK